MGNVTCLCDAYTERKRQSSNILACVYVCLCVRARIHKHVQVTRQDFRRVGGGLSPACIAAACRAVRCPGRRRCHGAVHGRHGAGWWRASAGLKNVFCALYRMCSLYNVLSIECVVYIICSLYRGAGWWRWYRICSLQTVSSIECFLTMRRICTALDDSWEICHILHSKHALATFLEILDSIQIYSTQYICCGNIPRESFWILFFISLELFFNVLRQRHFWFFASAPPVSWNMLDALSLRWV